MTEEKKRLIEYLRVRVKRTEEIMKGMKNSYAEMIHELSKDKLLIQNLQTEPDERIDKRNN